MEDDIKQLIKDIAEQVNSNAIKLSEIQGALHEHGQRLFDIEGSLGVLHQNKYDQMAEPVVEQEEKQRSSR